MSKSDFDTIQETKVQRPRLYRVVMLNDDYTPMEFVVLILQEVFRKTIEESHAIMRMVHEKGAGTVGVYTHEIAETLVNKAEALAQKNEEPLKVTMEPE